MVQADTNVQSGQIFVGGYGHSGTSLLANILDRHTEIHRSVGEVKVIERLPVISKEHPLDTPDQQAAFYRACVAACEMGAPHNAFPIGGVHPYADVELPEGWDEVPKDHLGIFFCALDHLAADDDAQYWLAKSMGNTIFSDLIFDRFPDNRFVIIVRDPRDVLAAKKTRVEMVETKFSGEQLAKKRLEKKYSPLLDAWSWWAQNKSDLELARSRPDQVLVVRYESVAGEPEATMTRICEFLDLKFEPSMLDVTFANSADMKVRPAGIYQNSGRFKTALSPSEIAFLQWVLRGPLARFDYELVQPISLADRLKATRFFVTGLVDLVDRLLSRFRLLGFDGFRTYLSNAFRKVPGRPGRTRT